MRLIILMILFLTIGCRPDKIPEDYDLEGVLLFEEIHSNLTQGWFPDLTAYNPATGERFLLTREKLFNVHPSWVRGGDQIIFESKRVRDHGSPSHIYVLNTRTSNISSLHPGMDLDRISGGHIQFMKPSVNNLNNKVYYYGYECGCIMSTGLNNGSMEELDILVDATSKIRWSNDYEYLMVHETVGRALSRQVRFSVYKSDTYEEIVSKDSLGWTYIPADMYNNKLLFVAMQRVPDALLSLRILNIETGEEKEIASYNRKDYNNLVSFRTPVFKDEQTIYYLRELSPNRHEVFKMDINTGLSEQITSDNTQKANLTIYREFH